MDFDYLKYVIEVAKRGSISKAAQHLFITQPYLSRIIKEIESELDIVLFIRTPQGIEATTQGKVFIQKAIIILEQYKGLRNIETNENKDNPVFSVSTIRSSLIMEVFLEKMKKFTDFDKYEFTFKESGGQTVIHDVAYYKADLGVIYMWDKIKSELFKKLERQDINYEKICDINNSIILGVNHPLLNHRKPITIEQLAPYGLVTYERQFMPYMLDHFPSDYLNEIIDIDKIPRKIYVNNRATLHNILYHTNSFSIGTQAARNQEKMFNLTSIPLPKREKTSNMEMGVLYRKNIDIHPIARAFIQKLKHNYSK